MLVASMLVTLVGGCAGRTVAPASSDPGDLGGAWYGDIGPPAGSLYTVEAQAVAEGSRVTLRSAQGPWLTLARAEFGLKKARG